MSKSHVEPAFKDDNTLPDNMDKQSAIAKTIGGLINSSEKPVTRSEVDESFQVSKPRQRDIDQSIKDSVAASRLAMRVSNGNLSRNEAEQIATSLGFNAELQKRLPKENDAA